MFIRVNDIQNKRYYKSMVYGLINTGYFEQAIVLNPYSACFELVDYLDKSTKKLKPLYEVINNNRNDWVLYEKTYLLKLDRYLKENEITADIKRFHGYKAVFDDFGFMAHILTKRSILLSETSIATLTNEDADDWNYIRTQQDADDFMKLFVCFHDATLDSLTYDEAYDTRQLKARFDNSGWYGVAECCFEGLLELNLRPYSENYTREMIGATLRVENESIFWADEAFETDVYKYDGSYIKALNMKWRKVEE